LGTNSVSKLSGRDSSRQNGDCRDRGVRRGAWASRPDHEFGSTKLVLCTWYLVLRFLSAGEWRQPNKTRIQSTKYEVPSSSLAV